MKITKQILDQAKSERGTFTAKQLRILREFPLRKGWKDRVYARDYSKESVEKFMMGGISKSTLPKNESQKTCISKLSSFPNYRLIKMMKQHELEFEFKDDEWFREVIFDNWDNATKHEMIIFHKLFLRGINFIFQKGFKTKNDYIIADFYLPEHNLIIEVDGINHLKKKQIVRDVVKNRFYRNAGYNVLRIRNESAHLFDPYCLRIFKDNGCRNVVYDIKMQSKDWLR